MYQKFNMNSKEAFLKMVSQNKVKDIGRGAEGTAYLMNNGSIMKCLDDKYQINEERQKYLLTANDVNVDHFCLPQNIYLVDGKIIGYDAAYFKNNLFNNNNHGVIDKAMAYKIIAAREDLLDDIRKLTELKYYLYDLRGNLLFDGENFGVIDTINYIYDEKIKILTNIISMDYAILYRLNKYDNTIDYNIGENVVRCLKRNNRI